MEYVVYLQILMNVRAILAYTTEHAQITWTTTHAPVLLDLPDLTVMWVRDFVSIVLRSAHACKVLSGRRCGLRPVPIYAFCFLGGHYFVLKQWKYHLCLDSMSVRLSVHQTFCVHYDWYRHDQYWPSLTSSFDIIWMSSILNTFCAYQWGNLRLIGHDCVCDNSRTTWYTVEQTSPMNLYRYCLWCVRS
jgi:hypothetical protein